MTSVTGTACARVGLLGNPSDVYEGRVLSFTFSNFSVRVFLEKADSAQVTSYTGKTYSAETWQELVTLLRKPGVTGGAELIVAAMKKFTDYCEEREVGPSLISQDAHGLRFKINFANNIPRQVGLGGSSAIIIATLRALMTRFQVPIEPLLLADMALRAETEELGITAGPQDRVIQAYEGLLYMDFMPPISDASYTVLDPALLPPLFIAWDPNPGESSGKAHADIRRRFEQGDEKVTGAITQLPGLADEGLKCLRRGHILTLKKLVDRNFDIRATIWPLSEKDKELVAIGRHEGAAVKFTGSGGAVVGIMTDQETYYSIQRAYEAADYRIIQPQVIPAKKSVRPQ